MVLISPLPTGDYARFHSEQTLRKIKQHPWLRPVQIRSDFQEYDCCSVSITMSKIAIGFAAAAIGIIGLTLSVSALQSQSMKSSTAKTAQAHLPTAAALRLYGDEGRGRGSIAGHEPGRFDAISHFVSKA